MPFAEMGAMELTLRPLATAADVAAADRVDPARAGCGVRAACSSGDPSGEPGAQR
jgi:hypothetical protein